MLDNEFNHALDGEVLIFLKSHVNRRDREKLVVNFDLVFVDKRVLILNTNFFEEDLLEAEGIGNHQLQHVGATEFEEAFEELLGGWLFLD